MLSVPAFDNSRVLVVGDVMLDRYWHGDTGRISPEAPVPVVRINGIEERVGGAANVALNLAALQAKALLLGVTGDDEHARRLTELLHDAAVDCPAHGQVQTGFSLPSSRRGWLPVPRCPSQL